MRSVFCVVALTFGVAALPAVAVAADSAAGQATGQTVAVEPEPELTHAQKLDKLFGELKRERSEAAAKRIVSRINQEWANSGSASVDLMMGWAKSAMEKQKFDIALDFLDQVITLAPDYAEGWNRRATVHFMMHNFGKSMADIEQTLELEPRHIGALAGLAQIMLARGQNELALQAFTQLLAIYPMDRNAQNQVSTIAEELAGESI